MTQLYSIIIGAVAIVFGALPVGAGWYPWYAAWLIMIAVMCIIFILFSSSITSSTSRPLLKRMYEWPLNYSLSLTHSFRLSLSLNPLPLLFLFLSVSSLSLHTIASSVWYNVNSCPCLYTYPARVWDQLEVELRICWKNRPCKFQRLVSQVVSSYHVKD